GASKKQAKTGQAGAQEAGRNEGLAGCMSHVRGGDSASRKAVQPVLSAHDLEKWLPVFRKDHARTKG
ncbi:MAG: hypothetical protein AB7S59_21620, partial [Parvibaculaceae bacterium]